MSGTKNITVLFLDIFGMFSQYMKGFAKWIYICQTFWVALFSSGSWAIKVLHRKISIKVVTLFMRFLSTFSVLVQIPLCTEIFWPSIIIHPSISTYVYMYVLIFFVFLSNLLNMLAGYHIAKVLTHEIRGQPILANLLKKGMAISLNNGTC